MFDFIVENDAIIRTSFFFAILVIMGSLETFFPRRCQRISKIRHWGHNLALVFLNSFVARIIFPGAAVGVASIVEINRWGILQNISLPPWVEVLIAVVALDLVIYLQHVLVHAIPGLWRLHSVHHADIDYDVTTGSRFHPIEILFSLVIKFSFITALGAPVAGVIIFEIILNGMAMFNHANYKLPLALDTKLRKLFVTPDVHRVHHSTIAHEANSNFGFNLSIWDRMFGTYKEQPELGHEQMQIGVKSKEEASNDVITLWGMLLFPFKSMIKGYSINDRFSN